MNSKTLDNRADVTLVKEVLKGDLSSFEVIVRRYQKEIYLCSLKILKDEEAAKDATQESFVRLFKNLGSFKQEMKLRPWLYKIAKNFCYDYLRKNSRLVSLEEQFEVQTDPGQTDIEKVIQEEEAQSVRHAVAKLPGIYRLPIIGYYYGNLNYQSVAYALQAPVNTVRTRLRRGKILLAKMLI